MQTNAAKEIVTDLIRERDALKTEAASWRDRALDLAQLIHEIDRIEAEALEAKRELQGHEALAVQAQTAFLTAQLASVTHALRALQWAINEFDDSGETLAHYWAIYELSADRMTQFDH